MFREFVAERNIPEIKKFIGNYVAKVIVYKDHVEVVFFLLYDEVQEANTYRFTRRISRRELLGKSKYAD
jgi:site-specific DNA recombinase